jgi:hypothetical protein
MAAVSAVGIWGEHHGGAPQPCGQAEQHQPALAWTESILFSRTEPSSPSLIRFNLYFLSWLAFMHSDLRS